MTAECQYIHVMELKSLLSTAAEEYIAKAKNGIQECQCCVATMILTEDLINYMQCELTTTTYDDFTFAYKIKFSDGIKRVVLFINEVLYFNIYVPTGPAWTQAIWLQNYLDNNPDVNTLNLQTLIYQNELYLYSNLPSLVDAELTSPSNVELEAVNMTEVINTINCIKDDELCLMLNTLYSQYNEPCS